MEGKKIDDFEFESKVLIFLQSKIALFKRSSKSCSLDEGYVCSEFTLVIEDPFDSCFQFLSLKSQFTHCKFRKGEIIKSKCVLSSFSC